MNILKIHSNFLTTKKIQLVTISLILITFLVLLVQSNVGNRPPDFLIHKAFYLTEYKYTGLNILKIISVLYSMLMCMYAFYISKYDIFLISRFSRKEIIISKIVVVLRNNLMFSIVLGVFYLCLWVMIDNNLEVNIIIYFLTKMSLFIIYFTILFSLLVIIFDNFFIIIIPFIGYLVSNLSIDYGIKMNELNATSKLLNVIFPDLIVINGGFEYVYGSIFVFSILLTNLSCILYYYTHKDIRI